MALRRYAVSAFVFVTALLLLVLLAEGTLRLAAAFGIGASPRERYNARIELSEEPALVWQHAVDDPRINAHGLRGGEVALDKAPGTFRIAALGDSIMYGYFLPLEESYPTRLAALLNEDPGGPRFEVLNFGVGGYNTRQELAMYELVARRFEPDLLLLGYSLNDVLDASALLGVIGSLPREESPRGPLEHSHLSRWIAKRARPAPKPAAPDRRYFVDLYEKEESWRIVADGFAGFAEVMRAEGRPVLVVLFPYLDDLSSYRYDALHARVRDEAERNGLHVLDLLEVFRGRDAAALRVGDDDLHPNAAGNELAASSTRTWLEANLPRLAGPAPATARSGR